MSASSYPGVNIPPPTGLPLHQQSVEVARSKIRLAIDALQRALSACIGIEISQHEATYALDQLYRAGACIAQGTYVLGLVQMSFTFEPAADQVDMSLQAIAERAVIDQSGEAKGGA